jgi:acyl phosphate:glycerol-3-phosphate acyltransferase
MTVLVAVAAVLGSYLLGSVPTGLLVARARGVDLRTVGSGNIGATNVARVLGKKLGMLVLILDALKGLVPTVLAGRGALSEALVATVGLAAIVGHIFPVWLRFRGGKGVATGLGVFLAVAPVAAVTAVVAYAVVFALWRISSIGSLVAATVLIAGMFVTHRPAPVIALAVAAWLLIVFRHRGNIARLIRGKEERF